MNLLPDVFFDVAQRIYANDSLWLPESPDAIRAQWQDAVDSTPELRTWIDVDPTDARLTGFYAPQQVIDGRRTAFFGFWEGIDDLPVNQRLFRSFENWAREQGAEQVVGPINITTFGNYRVRLNHFEQGAFPGEPYNPPYYPKLLEACGYQPVKHYFSWFGRLEGRAAAWATRMEPVIADLRAKGWVLERFPPEDWERDLTAIYALVDDVFGQNYAYRGISFEAFQRGYGAALAQRFCPISSVRVRDPQGDLAAFFLMFPDYGPLMQHGQLKPVTNVALRFTEHYPRLKQPRLLCKTGGVHPRYRQLGLFGLMTYLSASWGEANYVTAAATLVREDNPSRRIAEAYFSRPGDWRHDYALYGRSL